MAPALYLGIIYRVIWLKVGMWRSHCAMWLGDFTAMGSNFHQTIRYWYGSLPTVTIRLGAPLAGAFLGVKPITADKTYFKKSAVEGSLMLPSITL